MQADLRDAVEEKPKAFQYPAQRTGAVFRCLTLDGAHSMATRRRKKEEEEEQEEEEGERDLGRSAPRASVTRRRGARSSKNDKNKHIENNEKKRRRAEVSKPGSRHSCHTGMWL